MSLFQMSDAEKMLDDYIAFIQKKRNTVQTNQERTDRRQRREETTEIGQLMDRWIKQSKEEEKHATEHEQQGRSIVIIGIKNETHLTAADLSNKLTEDLIKIGRVELGRLLRCYHCNSDSEEKEVDEKVLYGKQEKEVDLIFDFKSRATHFTDKEQQYAYFCGDVCAFANKANQATTFCHRHPINCGPGPTYNAETVQLCNCNKHHGHHVQNEQGSYFYICNRPCTPCSNTKTG
jgi:hypothetical protein